MSETIHTEGLKAQIDYCKHMTTLSTGSIILLATFLEKLFAKPLWTPVMVVSFLGFVVCVVSSVVVHTMSVLDTDPFIEEVRDWRLTVVMVASVFIWIGFLSGVVGLAAFAIRNLVAQ